MSNYRGAFDSRPFRYRSSVISNETPPNQGSGSTSIGEGSILALSSRKIVSAYSGNIYRIRRSDNALQTIGLSGNTVDSTVISNFVGSNSAFIQDWYDQSSSSRNAFQTTNSRQPRISNSGSMELMNGKVAPNFISASGNVLDIPPITLNGDFTIFAVFNSSQDCMILGDTSNFQIRAIRSDAQQISSYDGSVERISTTLGVNMNNPSVCCWRRQANAMSFFQNKINYSPATNTSNNAITLSLIGAFFPTYVVRLNGRLAELIVFNSAISNADVSTKMQDQMDYWGL